MKSHGNSILASHEFSEMNDKPDQSISHGPMIRITQECPIMSLQPPVGRWPAAHRADGDDGSAHVPITAG